MPSSVCVYCRRKLEPRNTPSLLATTNDHYVPASRGGSMTRLACYHCNHLKGDMMPDEWAAFMAENPEWWRRPECQRRPPTVPVAEPNGAYNFRSNAPLTTHGTAAQQVLRRWFPEWFTDEAPDKSEQSAG